MENAIYYTFSTIAQALAAAFALLGAFVLVRLQQLLATSAASAEVVIRPYLPNEEARRLLASGHYSELSAYLTTQERHRPDAVRPHAYAAAADAFSRSLSLRQSILSQLRLALVITALVITMAVAVLALTPQIAASNKFATITLILGVISLAICLLLYGRLIWNAVK